MLEGVLVRHIDHLGIRCDDQGLDWSTCLAATLEDADWAATSELEVVNCQENSPLWADQGDFVLVGNSDTKTCVVGDGSGACVREVDARVSSTVVLPSGLRLLELACPSETDGKLVGIDRIVYDAEWQTPTCIDPSGHCSWALRPDATSASSPADANDDPRAWTTAITPYLDAEGKTALGTPGDPNGVAEQVATGGPPDPGEVVVAEIMVDYGTTPEWVELQATGDRMVELSGCWLLLERTGDAAGEAEEAAEQTCRPETPEECYKAYQIPDAISFPIGTGDTASLVRRVVAKGVCLSYGEPQPVTPTPGPTTEPELSCQLPADLNVGSALDFSSSEAETLHLWCPAADGSAYTEIDSFSYDWSQWNDLCAADDVSLTACSLQVHQDHADAQDNDCDFYRCVASSGEGLYYDAKGNLCAGTPGQPNDCPPIPYTPRGPAAGADARVLVIDEVSMLPEGDAPEVGRFSNEWFEIYNPGTETLDLGSCRFVIGDELDEDGFIVAPDSSYDLAAHPTHIEPGDYQLWAVDGCVMGSYTAASAATPTPAAATPTPGDVNLKAMAQDVACDIPADEAYESISFPNTTPKYFQLVCTVGCGQDEVIDTIYLDAEGQGIESGHSWELDPDYLDVEANDDPSHWCQAAYTQAFGREDLGKNYGTPGEANACIPPPDCGDVVVGCRCDHRDAPGSSPRPATFLLTGVLIAGLRLRARSRG